MSVDASASSDSDGQIVDYRWDFGDGNTTSGVTASHEFTDPGTYEILLEVEDGSGLLGTHLSTIDVQSPNQLPTAIFALTPEAGAAPLEVSFNGAPSFDPDGVISSYSWSFGDGRTAVGVIATAYIHGRR